MKLNRSSLVSATFILTSFIHLNAHCIPKNSSMIEKFNCWLQQSKPKLPFDPNIDKVTDVKNVVADKNASPTLLEAPDAQFEVIVSAIPGTHLSDGNEIPPRLELLAKETRNSKILFKESVRYGADTIIRVTLGLDNDWEVTFNCHPLQP